MVGAGQKGPEASRLDASTGVPAHGARVVTGSIALSALGASLPIVLAVRLSSKPRFLGIALRTSRQLDGCR